MKIIILLLLVFSINPIYAQSETEVLAEINSALKLIQEEIKDVNLTNIIIIAISLSIALIALGVAVYTGYFTRKTFEHYEKEAKLRTRPWIIIESLKPTQVTATNGDKIQYDGWIKMTRDVRPEMKSVKFWITIRNIGPAVARNVHRVLITKDEKFERKELENEVSALFPELAPNQETHYHFEMGASRFFDLEKKNLFVGLSVSYQHNNSSYSSGTIYGIEKGGNYVLDTWYT